MIRSLHGRLIVGAGLVYLAVYILFAWYYLDSRAQRLEKFHIQEFAEHTELIGDDVAEQMATGSMDSVRNILDHHAHDPDISDIKIFNNQGRVVSSTAGLEGQVDSSLTELDDYFKTESRYAHRRGKLILIVERLGNAPQCHRCHDPENEVLGYLEVGFRFVPEELDTAGFYSFLGGSGVLSVFILALALWLFQYHLVRVPLADLLATIQRTSGGDLTAQAKVGGTEEIKKLTTGFNQLVIRLAEAQQKIEVLHKKQMERAERLATAGELASGIAHEIKNPLAGISATIQIMLENVGDDAAQKEIMIEMATQIKRIEKTVKDLLAYACPPIPEFKKSDLNANIRRCVAFIASVAEQQRTSLKITLDDDIPEFLMDSSLIDQVLINLLMNALQALKSGGTVSVSSHYDSVEPTVTICVADNGPGMPQKIVTSAFRPFFTTKHRGSGLGLTISKNNVERHQGAIDVETQSGVGTKFTIRLPVDLSFERLMKQEII